MKHSLPKAARRLFVKWGRRGGKSRRKALTAVQRRAIAAKAAAARWRQEDSARLMPSVRLEKPSFHDPVYLEEILSEGALPEWRELYRQIADHPFGETARTLEKVVASVKIYGATRLWQSLLKNLQGGLDD